ncbi:putative ATP-dependent RNA helicase DDX31 [Dissostichus eleginoides]|uniref:ATP-dependent RNA helicase n=1 Tax=Dissostichus eleginoides TaxID=100907 RepID=A0AAD9F7P7_DISEL|nr:putative ATP-dependent RNA helicase DDX31 [Dissostichus eleginoides]
MSEDQLCLNISVSSSPSLRRKPLTTQQRWARKKQNAGKRKMNSSSQPEERRVKQRRPPPPAERADRRAPQKKKDGGGVMWQPPPPAERVDRRAPQKKKDGGGAKTSSLFKHNPDIPALLSPVVSQVKEKIFTSDSFSDMDLHPHLVATLNKVLNVSTVTSVQKQTMPLLLSGRDAVVRSQTGSGKTLAYAVPVVQSLQALQQKVSRSDGPLAVIIVPTREVCGTHCDSEP